MQESRRRFLKCIALGTGTASGGLVWWIATSKRRAASWARRLIADARRGVQPSPVKPEPQKWSENQITMCWIGHATVFINFYGIHILTDPALFDRIGVSMGIGTVGPKRFIAPALRVGELPPIDVLLLSHAHMDHMDLGSLRRFPSSTFTISAKATSDVLVAGRRKQLTELGWNEGATFRNSKGELRIEAVEVKHWGQRWPSEVPRGYNGYVLRREGKAILFGGDTALTPLFGQLSSRGPFETAIMPIGAYRPWIKNHCTPEQALVMADAARAKYVVPVHHQTFRLSEEPMNEPIERLQQALHREPERLALKRIGETFVCPRV
jgi:L-ascorbate metabolism protein UlaG (beta-lactamase superfamily)